MDDETAGLILAVQWPDSEHLKAMSKGKARESDGLSDAELAIRLQQEECEQAATFMNDRRMAHSIHRAVLDGGASVVILASEENQAAADRELACRLNGQTAPAHLRRHNLAADSDTLSRYSAFNNGDKSDSDGPSRMDISEDNEAESSAWAATRTPERHQHQCVACQERKETIEVPCQHSYCRDCIRRLFADAMVDETLFPPGCCRQNMPVSLVRSFLGTHLASEFEQKAIEFGTSNRTYCSNATCATFIDPSHIHGSTGTCPRQGCGTQTYILYKRVAHVGGCPHQDPFEDTLRLAEELGWQRCQRCQAMVELEIGCNHIT
ncbi:MAG: hypothetical protein Q9181_003466 [Wetmoreana brouardii]